jgi:predicted acylesterase/phospholipase RssA
MNRAPVLVDLALQGGGSHGAFTWGVLDRLLEESWLQIEGISGTSAGAMNAAVLVDGYAEGGADSARARLEFFWRRVSEAALLSPFRRSPFDILLGRWNNAEWTFLTMLRDEGRHSANAFLAAHGADLGARSTLDIDALIGQV